MIAPLVDQEKRVDYYIGAGASGIGAITTVVVPLKVMDDQLRLEDRIIAAGGMPAQGDVSCALLADAESVLERDAENELDGRAWYLHAGNIAFNTGIGLVLAIGYKHVGTGIMNGIVGSALGELTILSTPTDAALALERYRAGDLRPLPPQPIVRLGWFAPPLGLGGGLGLRGVF
jgi:hypothetical protein